VTATGEVAVFQADWINFDESSKREKWKRSVMLMTYAVAWSCRSPSKPNGDHRRIPSRGRQGRAANTSDIEFLGTGSAGEDPLHWAFENVGCVEIDGGDCQRHEVCALVK
jgi:hypothetical protein